MHNGVMCDAPPNMRNESGYCASRGGEEVTSVCHLTKKVTFASLGLDSGSSGNGVSVQKMFIMTTAMIVMTR